MILKHRQNRADVEVCKIDGVGDSVVQRRSAIFEQGNHFGMDGAENDQPPLYSIGLRRKPINGRLQMRTELLVALAIEVLEFIEDQDVTALCHRLQHLRELQ